MSAEVHCAKYIYKEQTVNEFIQVTLTATAFKGVFNCMSLRGIDFSTKMATPP